VDIFTYKFIIIPINEQFHWKLAIIHNPGKPADLKQHSSQPCILLFDSLGCESEQSPIFSNIRKYLEVEWEAKSKSQRRFNNLNMPGFAVEVPNQDNAIDCGVFVLKYVIQFCLCPPHDFSSKQTINNELGRFWFPISDIPKLRLSIQHTINQLINNNNTTSTNNKEKKSSSAKQFPIKRTMGKRKINQNTDEFFHDFNTSDVSEQSQPKNNIKQQRQIDKKQLEQEDLTSSSNLPPPPSAKLQKKKDKIPSLTQNEPQSTCKRKREKIAKVEEKVEQSSPDISEQKKKGRCCKEKSHPTEYPRLC